MPQKSNQNNNITFKKKRKSKKNKKSKIIGKRSFNDFNSDINSNDDINVDILSKKRQHKMILNMRQIKHGVSFEQDIHFTQSGLDNPNKFKHVRIYYISVYIIYPRTNIETIYIILGSKKGFWKFIR